MDFQSTEKEEWNEKSMDKKCFICGNCESIPKGSIGTYALKECSHCGLQFIEPVPDQKRLKEIYSEYYKAWGIENSEKEVSHMKKKTFYDYIEAIREYAPTGRLLDVGCATGEFMATAQENGYDAYGVEISPYGIDRCKALFGEEKIIAHNLGKGDFPPDFFDVITLADVLEHIREPKPFIETVWHILKPSGVLMIVTPNTSSWLKKVMGKNWPHYKEEHIYYYNSSNISNFSPNLFDKVVLNSAYKTLTLKYCLSVLNAYSRSGLVRGIARLLDYLPCWLKLYPLKMNVGEMFVIFRKKYVYNNLNPSHIR